MQCSKTGLDKKEDEMTEEDVNPVSLSSAISSISYRVLTCCMAAAGEEFDKPSTPWSTLPAAAPPDHRAIDTLQPTLVLLLSLLVESVMLLLSSAVPPPHPCCSGHP
jgi:hypothetical protein